MVTILYVIAINSLYVVIILYFYLLNDDFFKLIDTISLIHVML